MLLFCQPTVAWAFSAEGTWSATDGSEAGSSVRISASHCLSSSSSVGITGRRFNGTRSSNSSKFANGGRLTAASPEKAKHQNNAAG